MCFQHLRTVLFGCVVAMAIWQAGCGYLLKILLTLCQVRSNSVFVLPLCCLQERTAAAAQLQLSLAASQQAQAALQQELEQQEEELQQLAGASAELEVLKEEHSTVVKALEVLKASNEVRKCCSCLSCRGKVCNTAH
jgi:septal ring factor EnvC (AmiA/AmiB activator)